ncbi:MAG: DapH/DapD/GlmU-related protein [Candidatus Margulisbacteria bacterium]|nr:DapH/DapD/GlmU-related protein [Candidatus Margulisiibacteriota bacterium]
MANYKIYPNVKMGNNVTIGEYCVIGEPAKDGDGATVIGDNAVIRSHTVIYAGNKIGNNFSTGHGVLIRENNQFGDNVSLGSHSVVEHHVVIGNNVRAHSQVFIPEYSTLHEGAWLGPNVVLTNARYPLSKHAKQELQGPIIMPKAKIGGNSTILPGVTVGANALVGAGSVVTKDVPAGKVVAGNPAKVIKDIKELPY